MSASSGLRILIADDDPTARNFLRAALRRLEHECVLASNGREAWEAYQTHQPALVLADWIMPELSGPELCRMIRAENRPRYTYVILVTALTGKGSYLEGMEAGADDFVTKPFDIDQMRARLRVARRILGLQTELKQLEGLLPICAYCRRIREENADWATLEDYVARRTEVTLTHGICPECYHDRIAPEMQRLGIADYPGGRP